MMIHSYYFLEEPVPSVQILPTIVGFKLKLHHRLCSCKSRTAHINIYVYAGIHTHGTGMLMAANCVPKFPRLA